LEDAQRTDASASDPKVLLEEALLVELPREPPLLTPGLARALGRVIVKASRVAEHREVRDGDGSEVLAS